MNKTLKENINDFDEDEIFDDSTLLANLESSAFKDNSDKNLNKSLLNVSALSCDEEINGYDRLSGKTWIYPTNYPVRDYQFNIIRAAILKNTLVSLPTGLGKTFIAAVIMYNFYRWYPLGKIVFTAPTRPLVAQQIEACFNIVALPAKDTIEMTGHMQVNSRKQHWQTKRVFFATPQVIYNDIKSGICPSDKIRCLVVDEAHRARGNYAYCQIVSTLSDMGHKTYRVLGLSATPGSKVEDVVNVVKNLNIAHLELRTENCIDVAPYSHTRKINTVIIPLGPELTHLRQQYVEILDGYARRLKQLNILPHNLGNLSKGRVVMLYKEFQTKDRGARHPQHNNIMKDFTLLIALYHGLELLLKHGSRVFLNFFDEHPEKSWIQSDDQLTALLERLRDDLGINPLSLDRSTLPDGTVPDMPKNLSFGHPKFYKLKEIMVNHFRSAKERREDTKAIVFCEYRESVNLVHCLLLQCRPLIVPLMFVGQGASGKDGKTVISQKQQLRVMRSFREGTCNTLVCTCVAEEGLDVGSVDLILCFDISTRSPIRLVQRCGRTGRERGGQVHILVTEGREHQTLIDCIRQRDGLNNRILQSKEVENNLYKSNPRLIPHDFMPDCQKMHITVPKKIDTKDKAKKGQKDLRSMLKDNRSVGNISSKVIDDNELITETEFNEIYPNGFESQQSLCQLKEYWPMNKGTIIETSKQENKNVKLHTWLEWQRFLQKTVNVGHSMDTEILTSLLKYSDSKRFDVPPSTQNPSFNTQDFQILQTNVVKKKPSPVKTKLAKKKIKVPVVKSPSKKDGDIRSLFSTATKSTKDYTKLINDLGIQNTGNLPTSFLNLLVDLNLEVTNTVKKCYICLNICVCKVIDGKNNKQNFNPELFLNGGSLTLPDINLIDDIDVGSMLKCTEVNLMKSSHILQKCVGTGVDSLNQSKNFNLQFDFDLSNSPHKEIVVASKNNVEQNFDIGDIEDIFVNSSPVETIDTAINGGKAKDPKETLGFFGLDSIDDIFADSDDDYNIENVKSKNDIVTKLNIDKEVLISSDDDIGIDKKNGTPSKMIKSPSLLSGRVRNVNIPTSPILCSQPRKYQLSTKKSQMKNSTPISNAKKKLILEPASDEKIKSLQEESINSSKLNIIQNKSEISTNKSMFTITQLVEMINNDSTTMKTNVEIEDHSDKRSSSPILLTQADRKSLNFVPKCSDVTTQNSKPESIIILESDSCSDSDTEQYDAETVMKLSNQALTMPQIPDTKNNEHPNNISVSNDFENIDKHDLYETTESDLLNRQPRSSPKTPKRKLEDDEEIVASPYFNKKQKLEEPQKECLTLREKVLATLSSNKFNTNYDGDANVEIVLHSPNTLLQKENKDPINNSYEKSVDRIHNMLQMFRKGSKIASRKINFEGRLKKSIGLFEESDDDFAENNKDFRSQTPCRKIKRMSQTNYKVRKNRQKPSEFLDLEAELSSSVESGDELSEDSVGSLADFIDDDAHAHVDSDMRALYLKSIKSPVNGVFKIPELPMKFNRHEVLSQYVEEDNYEMDSFCVDPHIGLTQTNDVSELELAEMILEERKRKRKLPKENFDLNSTDSPLVRRKLKKIKRQINSDSDDSS